MDKIIKNLLNRMVHIERESGNNFELGEFIDMTVHQIPYIRFRDTVENIRQWELNSLKLSNGIMTINMLKTQYDSKIKMLANGISEGTALFPINIICQLIDFLYIYQNRKKYFKKKIKVSLENDQGNAVCRIFTDINASDHWFADKDDKVWRIVRQYTSSINLHSSFVEVEKLDCEDKCLVLIKFDMSKYYDEEKEVLSEVRKIVGMDDTQEFKKNIFHVLHCLTEKDFIKLVDSRILANKWNSLYWEFNFMNRLKGLKGFPNVKQYMKIGNYELYIANKINGKSLEDYLADNDSNLETSLLFKLFDQIQKLKQNYLVHRDLSSSNVIISSSGDVYIIDFDQAAVNLDSSNRVDLSKSKYCVASPCITLFDTIYSVEKVKNNIKEIQIKLEKLWQKAAKSDSSSPGAEVAYYTYRFGDADYSGEREFFERWILIEKNNIPLKGKNVVELGCNIGLFGAYSALYGANFVKSFDIDSEIIECAKELVDIMELKNITHEVRDLNQKGAFGDINEIDFMFALSVLFWLKDTTEFDRLMGIAKEVLYEGHEHHDAEYMRLKKWGFSTIKAVGITDRLRTIFYASKQV